VSTQAPAADARWDDLVDRLAVYDIHYLTGGSAWDGNTSRYQTPSAVPVDALILDLAGAAQARLRDALVALLFRHPELASTAILAADRPDERERTPLLIRASVLVAAALRVQWSFVLGIYLPGQPTIQAEHVTRILGVPSPSLDYGRPCLSAVAELLRAGQPFPFAFERGWQDVAEHVLDELRREARTRSA
jgi:hypothetical protein